MTPRGPRRAQIRTRILIAVLPITLIALGAFDVAAVTALRGYLLSQVDSQLHTVLAPLPGPRLGNLLAQVESGHWRLLPIVGEFYVAYLPRHGPRVILEEAPNAPGSGPRIPSALSFLAASPRTLTVTTVNGNGQLRLQAIRAAGGALVATASLDAVDKTVGRLQLIVTLGSAATGLLVALGVALVARRGLRPVEMMAAQADRITAGDLTDRVSSQDDRTEVGRLGTALNGMLARIEASVHEREASQELTRQFFADASHELRNPLASLRANAELYQQGALARRPQVDEAMRRIALEAQRMSRLVDDMLRLARLDQAPDQQHDPVDLTALATECAQRAQVGDPRRAWQTRIAPDLVTVGDQELLRRAIDNLLANVHAHTPDDTVATITATSHGGRVSVDVSDNGPGVPAGHLPRIFDRFYRAGAQSDCPGSGLGLAIVTAIATAHRGSAQAALNHPRGLRITLSLPVAGEQGPE